MVKPKLLFHICCAPCSAFLIGRLSKDFSVTAYFENSNIFPKKEFHRRLTEAEKFFSKSGQVLIAAPYDHQKWLATVKGFYQEPERGERCRRCYRWRLEKTARFARRYQFDFFGSVLAVSPHKDAFAINQLGRKTAEAVKVSFLAGDWKKDDVGKKTVEMAKKYNFYRQDYCGCEFSRPLAKN